MAPSECIAEVRETPIRNTVSMRSPFRLPQLAPSCRDFPVSWVHPVYPLGDSFDHALPDFAGQDVVGVVGFGRQAGVDQVFLEVEDADGVLGAGQVVVYGADLGRHHAGALAACGSGHVEDRQGLAVFAAVLQRQFGQHRVERFAEMRATAFGFGEVADDLAFPFGERFDFAQHQACAFYHGHGRAPAGDVRRVVMDVDI